MTLMISECSLSAPYQVKMSLCHSLVNQTQNVSLFLLNGFSQWQTPAGSWVTAPAVTTDLIAATLKKQPPPFKI